MDKYTFDCGFYSPTPFMEIGGTSLLYDNILQKFEYGCAIFLVPIP